MSNSSRFRSSAHEPKTNGNFNRTLMKDIKFQNNLLKWHIFVYPRETVAHPFEFK
jgi:hypothetical protein